MELSEGGHRRLHAGRRPFGTQGAERPVAAGDRRRPDRADRRVGAALHRRAAHNRRVLRSSGRLYLGVNDDHLDDNSGEYRVSVTIQQR